MTESKPDQCSLCYWWDAAPHSDAWVLHHYCHEPHGKKLEWFTTAEACCEHFRPITPDDGTVLWRRGNPGVKRRKPKDPAAVKRGRAAKKKGHVREKELADLMSKLTGEKWLVCGHDKDVQPEDPNSWWRQTYHVECKGHKRVAAYAFCEQAMADAVQQGKPAWFNAYRCDAKPGHNKPPWIVQVDLVSFVRDMAELAERRAREDAEE